MWQSTVFSFKNSLSWSMHAMAPVDLLASCLVVHACQILVG